MILKLLVSNLCADYQLFYQIMLSDYQIILCADYLVLILHKVWLGSDHLLYIKMHP